MTKGEAVNWLINIMADIGKAEHSELWHYEQALSEIRELLEAPPERKRGNWVGIDDEPCETFECDRCGFVLEDWIQGVFYSFCPNCGADMRGEE